MTASQTFLKLLAALNISMETEIKDSINITKITEIIQLIQKRRNLANSSQDTCCNGCDGFIKDASDIYNRYHGYLSLVVCLFGTIANLLNIIVLTRKEMVVFPVNRILGGLAVADMFVMIEYIPFAYFYSIMLPQEQEFPYSLAVYMLFHGNFAQVLHTISMSLTLTLAIWRFIVIKYPERSHILCTNYRCTVAICASYVLPIFICIPSYFFTTITRSVVVENGKNYTLYHVHLSHFAANNKDYFFFVLWTYSIVIKWFPCFILTILSYCLVKTLYQAAKRKQVIRGYNQCPTEIQDRRIMKTERRTERTTKMLLAVLLLFLLTEVPQAILILLSAIRGKAFFIKCYYVIGNFMDILALINGAINFILYCSMSRQFRQTFGQLFKPHILNKRAPPSQTELQSTYV